MRRLGLGISIANVNVCEVSKQYTFLTGYFCRELWIICVRFAVVGIASSFTILPVYDDLIRISK